MTEHRVQLTATHQGLWEMRFNLESGNTGKMSPTHIISIYRGLLKHKEKRE